MSTGLCAEDFEVFLDPQSTCPAVFQERMFQINEDEWELDFVTSQEDLCWMPSNQTLYVWDMKATSGSGLKMLPLPLTGFPPTSRLSCVFRDTGKKVPSAILLLPEGQARWWPSVGLNTFFDTKMSELNGEVPVSVQLLQESTKDHGPVFVAFTSSGTFLTLSILRDGSMEIIRIAEVESKAANLRRRMSAAIFGATKDPVTDYVRSIIYEHNNTRLLVGISHKALKAVDVASKKLLWTVDAEAKEGLCGLFRAYLEEVEEEWEEPEKLFTHIVDAQYFKGGILVLFAGMHDYSDAVKFYLVHLSDVESMQPKFGIITDISIPDRMAAQFEVGDSNSYLGQVRLLIPRLTADAPLIARTDGILIVHANYVHAIYVPDDLTEGISLSQEYYLPDNQRIIGYGTSNEFAYVMLTTGQIQKLRLLPKNFPKVHNAWIVELVEDMHRPDRGIGLDIYIALRHFLEKNFGDSAERAVKILRENDEDAVLRGVRMALANVVGNIVIHGTDFLTELRDRKRFYDAYILFLKHAKILSKIVDAEFQEHRSGPPLQGAEAITEFNERISVLEHLFKWTTNLRPHGSSTSEEQGLIHGVFRTIIGSSHQFNLENWKKMEYLTQIPEAALRCMENFKVATANFVFEERFVGFRLFCDLFTQFYKGVTYARRTTTAIQQKLGEVRWTSAFIHVYPKVCAFLLTECESEGYSNEVKRMLVEYVVNFMKFFFKEHSVQPNGDPILIRMWQLGYPQQSLDLANHHKDFKIICDMLIGLEPVDRQREADRLKQRFSEDQFEEYYLDYLAEKKDYDELLKQRGEMATMKINEMENVRWRRDIENGDFTEAGRTLQSEADREKCDLQKKKQLQALNRLSLLCVDRREEDVREELTEANLHIERVNLQEKIPSELLKEMYHDDWEKPLTIQELLQLGFHVIEHEDCTQELLVKFIMFAGRLIQWDEKNAADFVKLIFAAWKKVLSKTQWTQIYPHNFKDTLFARVVKDIIHTDTKIALYCFPKAVGSVVPELENTSQGRLISAAFDKAMEEIQRYLDTGIPPRLIPSVVCSYSCDSIL